MSRITTHRHRPPGPRARRRLSSLPRRALSAASAAAAAAVVSGCAGLGSASGTFHPRRHGVLTVVTQPFPTAGFWTGAAAHPTGGLEYELARHLAERFGLRLSVRTEPFTEIVAGHLDGADLAMALITPTADRRQVLDFSAPYVDSPPAVLVRAGVSVPDLQSAQQLRWAVESDTTLDSTVTDVIQPKGRVLRFGDRAGVLRALDAGRADATLFDLPAALAIAHRDRRLDVAAHLTRDEPIAAALRPGSDNVQAVSSAMRAMTADGTIDRLAQRWLGASISDGEDNVALLRTNQS